MTLFRWFPTFFKRHFFFENRKGTTDKVPEEVQKWLDIANEINEGNARMAYTIEWLENSAAFQQGGNFSVNFQELYSD